MHYVLALTNAYLLTIHGADADAKKFHRLAVEWAAMGFFHKALILYMLFLLPVLFLWFPKKISNFSDNRKRFLRKRFIIIGAIFILTD